MEKYKNLTIIGTSHIAIQSIKEVKEVLLKEKPNIIALELDKKRFYALLSKKRKISIRDILRLGLKGFILNLVGAWIEEKLGKIVKVKPGSEMKTAIKIARKLKSKIALIDQDIETTLKKLSKNITWKEKLRFVFSIFKAFFKRPKIKIDLTKVPSKKIIKRLTDKLKEDYPSIYNILIKERNGIMAKNLNKLMETNKSIVAVVGAGHEEDLIKLIKNVKI